MNAEFQAIAFLLNLKNLKLDLTIGAETFIHKEQNKIVYTHFLPLNDSKEI
jgi:hypothetical protein